MNYVTRREFCFTFYICRYTPDVVFLQELIPSYIQYLKKRAVSYLFVEGKRMISVKLFLGYFADSLSSPVIKGSDDGYFTAIMLKKSRLKLLESEIISYPTTQMLRNLLVAQVSLWFISAIQRLFVEIIV